MSRTRCWRSASSERHCVPAPLSIIFGPRWSRGRPGPPDQSSRRRPSHTAVPAAPRRARFGIGLRSVREPSTASPQQTGRHGTDQDNGVLDPRRSTVAVRTRLASFGCQRVHGPSGPVAYAAAGCALSRTGFLGYSKASSPGRGRSRTACTSRGRSKPQSRPDGLAGRHRAGSRRARPRPARHRHPRRPVMTGETRTLRHARRTVHPTAVDTGGGSGVSARCLARVPPIPLRCVRPRRAWRRRARGATPTTSSTAAPSTTSSPSSMDASSKTRGRWPAENAAIPAGAGRLLGWLSRAHPNRGYRSWGLKPPVSSRLRAM